jgi:hypothetical protein
MSKEKKNEAGNHQEDSYSKLRFRRNTKSCFEIKEGVM